MYKITDQKYTFLKLKGKKYHILHIKEHMAQQILMPLFDVILHIICARKGFIFHRRTDG